MTWQLNFLMTWQLNFPIDDMAIEFPILKTLMMNGIGSMRMWSLKALLLEKRIKRQGSSGNATQSNNVVDEKRKTERAENVMHLICWGPTHGNVIQLTHILNKRH